MIKTLRTSALIILTVASSLLWHGQASADDFTGTTGANQQDGDNQASTTQSGTSHAGSSVGGQVVGVVSSGDASVNAKNRADDVDVTTGDATSAAHASSFVGLSSATNTTLTADFTSATASGNQQAGDNEFELSQATEATSGDGVGGQVIGVVTSVNGAAGVVGDNESTDINVETGDATASSEASSFVGLLSASQTSLTADFTSATATGNQQEGDNTLDGSQSADATTGDAVGGQVLGVTSGGSTSLNGKNRSDDIDLQTGDASATTTAASFVGLSSATFTTLSADFTSATAGNQQQGDNEGNFDQKTNASSGDAVGGQVAGVVTTAGGAASLALDNESTDIDADSGSATDTENSVLFVGLVGGSTLDLNA